MELDLHIMGMELDITIRLPNREISPGGLEVVDWQAWSVCAEFGIE